MRKKLNLVSNYNYIQWILIFHPNHRTYNFECNFQQCNVWRGSKALLTTCPTYYLQYKIHSLFYVIFGFDFEADYNVDRFDV